MFDKMKAFLDMQNKMQEMKRQLEATTFEVESSDKKVKMVMNGSQEVKHIEIDSSIRGGQAGSLEAILKDTFNKAIKRSHEIAAEKMKGVVGFDLPGLT